MIKGVPVWIEQWIDLSEFNQESISKPFKNSTHSMKAFGQAKRTCVAKIKPALNLPSKRVSKIFRWGNNFLSAFGGYYVWDLTRILIIGIAGLRYFPLTRQHSLWASSFSWNARDGADSQVLGVTLAVKLIFVFSVTFGTKGLWGWSVARELFE